MENKRKSLIDLKREYEIKRIIEKNNFEIVANGISSLVLKNEIKNTALIITAGDLKIEYLKELKLVKKILDKIPSRKYNLDFYVIKIPIKPFKIDTKDWNKIEGIFHKLYISILTKNIKFFEYVRNVFIRSNNKYYQRMGKFIHNYFYKHIDYFLYSDYEFEHDFILSYNNIGNFIKTKRYIIPYDVIIPKDIFSLLENE